MLVNKIFATLILGILCWVGTAAAEGSFTLGNGDVLQISVYGHPDLSLTKRVSEDGSINFPLVGEVSVAGMSERQAEVALARELERKQIVRNPQVSVVVQQYQTLRVSVLGNVSRPGVFEVRRGSTVVDLIAAAGGLGDQAGHVATLTRGSERTSIDLAAMLDQGDATANVMVGDGDQIYIPRTPRFYIYGQVNHPNVYRLEPDMTVMQAISIAGGLTDKGTERGITIKRGGNGEDMDSVAVGASAKIEDNDVVYVKESLF